MANQTTKRTDMFQHIVLAGLWILIRCAFGKQPIKEASDFKSDCLYFGDLYGDKSEGAKDFRRNITYGGSLK